MYENKDIYIYIKNKSVITRWQLHKDHLILKINIYVAILRLYAYEILSAVAIAYNMMQNKSNLRIDHGLIVTQR